MEKPLPSISIAKLKPEEGGVGQSNPGPLPYEYEVVVTDAVKMPEIPLTASKNLLFFCYASFFWKDNFGLAAKISYILNGIKILIMIGGNTMKTKSSILPKVVLLCLMLTSLSCSRMSAHWSPGKKKGFGPPPHAKAHGYRSKLPAEVEVVFDTNCGVYVVVGLDRHFWLDGQYYRFYNGQWELSMTIDGGWRSVGRPVDGGTLPPGLRGKYKTKHVSKKHPGRGWGLRQD